jgi:hypothetical protein
MTFMGMRPLIARASAILLVKEGSGNSTSSIRSDPAVHWIELLPSHSGPHLSECQLKQPSGWIHKIGEDS